MENHCVTGSDAQYQNYLISERLLQRWKIMTLFANFTQLIRAKQTLYKSQVCFWPETQEAGPPISTYSSGGMAWCEGRKKRDVSGI